MHRFMHCFNNKKNPKGITWTCSEKIFCLFGLDWPSYLKILMKICWHWHFPRVKRVKTLISNSKCKYCSHLFFSLRCWIFHSDTRGARFKVGGAGTCSGMFWLKWGPGNDFLTTIWCRLQNEVCVFPTKEKFSKRKWTSSKSFGSGKVLKRPICFIFYLW